MLSPERRPSMAERRPSIFAHALTPLVVPHLAGIEDHRIISSQ